MQFNTFLFDQDQAQSDIVEWGDYSIGYFIVRNKEKSTSNEDVLFINALNDSMIWGVADGAGGHPRGKDAAYICGNEIQEQKADKLSLNPVDLIESANEKVLALKAGARSTFSFGVLKEDTLKCYSVGDSEIVYWNSLGAELYSNIPHTQVGYKIQAGVLDQEESLDDEDRYLVNNLMGDASIRIESTSKMNLKKGHTILIGSDGVFDNLSHEQLKNMIFPGDFKESFRDLCNYFSHDNSENWKKNDDISFVLVRKIK